MTGPSQARAPPKTSQTQFGNLATKSHDPDGWKVIAATFEYIGGQFHLEGDYDFAGSAKDSVRLPNFLGSESLA